MPRRTQIQKGRTARDQNMAMPHNWWRSLRKTEIEEGFYFFRLPRKDASPAGRRWQVVSSC